MNPSLTQNRIKLDNLKIQMLDCLDLPRLDLPGGGEGIINIIIFRNIYMISGITMDLNPR